MERRAGRCLAFHAATVLLVLLTAGGVHTLRALVRPPTSPERAFWERQFADAGSPAERARLLEDAVWSVLNGAEFATNH